MDGMRRLPAALLIAALALWGVDALSQTGPGVETAPGDSVSPENMPETAAAFEAASGVSAADVPNDDSGKGLNVAWEYVPQPDQNLLGFRVLRRKDAPGSALEPLNEALLPPDARSYHDLSAAPPRNDPKFTRQEAAVYRYAVQAAYEGGTVDSAESAPAFARSNWFNTNKVWMLLAALLFGGMLALLTQRSRAGAAPKIRRIAGLEAVDEAIGRATEEGRPILYVAGIGSVQQMSTIASINIFSHVIKTAGEYATRILTPCYDPIVMQVMRSVGQQTYQNIGRPDAFDPSSIFFVTESQFAYAAAVDGIMVREKPAAIFLQGMFYAESLILAETGHSVNAVQIAGTDKDAQLPFFIAACDYTLIGEELFAASAYLSQDAPLLSAIRAQDIAKALLMALMIAGALLQLFGVSAIADIFKVEM